MPIRPSTKTIPGSTIIEKRWKFIRSHTDPEQDAAVANSLFFFIDRTSIAISNRNKTAWGTMQYDKRHLLKNEEYLITYMMQLKNKEVIPAIHSIISELVDPNRRGTLNNLDPTLRSEEEIRTYLDLYYQPILNGLRRDFPANPDLTYKPITDLNGILNRSVAEIKNSHIIDLPSIIFKLFDDQPYCHLSRQSQLSLGIPDWKTSRKPSQYSLRILGLIITSWREFGYREPQDTQELIDVLCLIMFYFMKRWDYLGLQQTLTINPEPGFLTIIHNNNSHIKNLEDFYYLFRTGAQYLMTRETTDVVSKFKLGEF